MKIFVLGLPHTQTSKRFTTCAFTMKAYHLCKMLHRRGHEVIHLGTEGSDPECTENVSVMPEARHRELYGHPGTSFYNLETQKPGHKEYHDDFAANMRAEILKRTPEPSSAIICVTWGGAQQVAVQDLPQFVVESGIGYPHTWAKYRVFESHAWAHMLYGKEGKFVGQVWYDAVIPNAFDPEMFTYSERPGDYLLYFGRLNEDKGVGIACDVAKRVGMRIKIVGQGDPAPFLAVGKHVEYIPPVGVEGRRELMSGAKALLCPTWYIEPFGGVNVESQMSGTPVIATNFGVYPETVIHGVTGYLGRTMEEFVWAARNVDKLSRKACRDWALANYSLDRVALMYEEYFQRLLNIRGEGWYTENSNRTQLDCRRRVYPDGVHEPLDLTRPLEVPPPPVVKSEWERATDFESSWWGLDPNERWNEEVRRQDTYARLMGLPADLDLGKATRVLDIGCGPTSMLLRADRHGATGFGVDPLPVSRNTLQRYKAANVLFNNEKAENIDPMPGVFDEAWIYNCLQHTEDPSLILSKVKIAAHLIRIFEWVNTAPAPGHPQTLTEGMFSEAFDGWEWVKWETGMLNEPGLHGEYIAIVVKRPDTLG
jgi:glycosyltransferase involved in cell wall biosynthesis/SAM-dependent methyltransferase